MELPVPISREVLRDAGAVPRIAEATLNVEFMDGSSVSARFVAPVDGTLEVTLRQADRPAPELHVEALRSGSIHYCDRFELAVDGVLVTEVERHGPDRRPLVS